jgi:desulfoferrodoxin-like iron-binding protein
MSNLGKRYKCEKCGTEILCVKEGEGAPSCCGENMAIQEPRKIESSD